jgi:hypothetical protein
MTRVASSCKASRSVEASRVTGGHQMSHQVCVNMSCESATGHCIDVALPIAELIHGLIHMGVPPCPRTLIKRVSGVGTVVHARWRAFVWGGSVGISEGSGF